MLMQYLMLRLQFFSFHKNNLMLKVVSEVEMKMWLAYLLTYISLPLHHPLCLAGKLLLFPACYLQRIK